MENLDIFAETNPAFCSIVLFNFCKGYNAEASDGVDYPLILLPLPIVLSGDLEISFVNTRVDTGFFSWIDRNPTILLNLTDRIQDTLAITRNAMEFGVSKTILRVVDTGKIQPYAKGLCKKKFPPSSSKVGRAYTNACRLGQWLGQIHSVTTIYNHLGLEI